MTWCLVTIFDGKHEAANEQHSKHVHVFFFFFSLNLCIKRYHVIRSGRDSDSKCPLKFI